MNESSNLRQLLLAYKLGELPSAERSELEERMVNDETFSDQLEEAEYDLIDDYRAHRLSTLERSRVEKAFSREQLMRALPAATPQLQRRSAAQPIQRQNTSHSTSAWPRLWLPMAATALVLLAATSWFVGSRHLRQHKDNYAAATSGTAHFPAAPANNTASLHTLPNAAATAVLLLGTEVTRGTPAAKLQLPPAVTTLRVQWMVPQQENETAFCLSVAKNGKVLKAVTQHGGLHDVGGSRVAEFLLAAQDIPRQKNDARYLFIVSSAASRHEVIGEYPVAVQEKNN
jgi:anti-sigma factor RsiW